MSKRQEEEMSAGLNVFITIMSFMILVAAILAMSMIYCAIITIDTNLTIATRTGWVYIGEGIPSDNLSFYEDCYGNEILKESSNMIGTIEIKSSNVYTPVPNLFGYNTLPLPSNYIKHLNRNSTYLVYEKRYWFNSHYLVICK